MCIIAPVWSGEWFPDDETPLTNDIEDVAGQELRDVDDPFRDGSFSVSE